jgi:hypothetical protein
MYDYLEKERDPSQAISVISLHMNQLRNINVIVEVMSYVDDLPRMIKFIRKVSQDWRYGFLVQNYRYLQEYFSPRIHRLNMEIDQIHFDPIIKAGRLYACRYYKGKTRG